jgi:GNAT superfamily N-acetyltransferase
MNLSARKAVMEDASAISHLSNQLGYNISEPTTLQNLELILQNPNEIVYVAENDKQVIGWIHVFKTIRLESGEFCEIGGLIVHEQYRNIGVGKLLLEHAKEWCRQVAVPVLRVRCNIKRKEGNEFYTASGFWQNKQQTVFEITC